MRTAPVIIAARNEIEAIENALLQTRLTHGCTECLQYSEAFARELWIGKALDEYRHLKLLIPIVRSKVREVMSKRPISVLGGLLKIHIHLRRL